MKKTEEKTKIESLLETVKTLRSPGGCPWDLEQTHQSLKKYLLEETYEVLEAIDQNNISELKEELGDLLLQIALHAQIASDNQNFNFQEIADSVNQKMIIRHPHVFLDSELEYDSDRWEQIKKQENNHLDKKIFDSIPRELPALAKAIKIIKKIERNNLEHKKTNFLEASAEEELKEFMRKITSQEELGKFLLSMLKICKEKKLDPEDSLRMSINNLLGQY